MDIGTRVYLTDELETYGSNGAVQGTVIEYARILGEVSTSIVHVRWDDGRYDVLADTPSDYTAEFVGDLS